MGWKKERNEWVVREGAQKEKSYGLASLELKKIRAHWKGLKAAQEAKRGERNEATSVKPGLGRTGVEHCRKSFGEKQEKSREENIKPKYDRICFR